MSGQIKTPAANGGGCQQSRAAGYSPAFRPAISDWLNPRRRQNAETLLDYIRWHGRKIHLTADTYADLRQDNGLDAYAVDAAADDLYALGCINISMNPGYPVLSVLSTDIDRMAGLAGRGRR